MMLREAYVAHDADWYEKTMSMLREKQFEACERRLSTYPDVSLFSPDATDTDAQTMLECSFYQSEPGNEGLVTLQTLRNKVIERLPVEALYLSRGENTLMERLLIADGRITSDTWDEIDAAEALANRLWCSFTDEGEEWTLELAPSLREPMLLAFNNPGFAAARARLFRYDATIQGLLYIAGFLHCGQPLTFFTKDVMERTDALAADIGYRYLKASFEYVADRGREIVLMHPGLADPRRLMVTMGEQTEFTLSLSEETLSGGMNGLLPEEEPLHQRMLAALLGMMRPEWEAEEAAEDLRLLAKQGVALEEMEAVMASMICVLPTPAMKNALKNLYDCTPHWIGMTANLRH
ncbi:MAG: hypothetical protein LLF96_03900 [Eubacteriales bacterium]|nr:hypothetical protein [Eubacteriales bacterium]